MNSAVEIHVHMKIHKNLAYVLDCTGHFGSSVWSSSRDVSVFPQIF